ncbi:uncharacterized protein DUF4244 [Halopolyspora algeriensis]|uniref:Uncharacterized protein DUF4244 n=1 Tax=Halopolyspora algeriensis TaxID=1500506 RepID=A0A368VG23_9ACTN|nr:DUF4244 domain-containing protein [Halopolyspora algeriensis]RCW40198.1 uncharacterized protein DUF4244 [Halopolyspora algeriensis]TQM46320.1 uncharacterized protein DUF4244 [Halopolyspora algeriensis]
MAVRTGVPEVALRLSPSRWRRVRELFRGDGGMSTAEYAIGTLAAAAFASLLYTVLTGDAVTQALTSLIRRALEAGA